MSCRICVVAVGTVLHWLRKLINDLKKVCMSCRIHLVQLNEYSAFKVEHGNYSMQNLHRVQNRLGQHFLSF